MQYRFLIISAGFSGSVLANRLTNKLDRTIGIFYLRGHVSGSCHTERDGETGIMVHKYGPHIFKPISNGKVYSLSVSLPQRLRHDKDLLMKYRQDAARVRNASFLGKLATYRYMDMHHVIGEALEYPKTFIGVLKKDKTVSVSPGAKE